MHAVLYDNKIDIMILIYLRYERHTYIRPRPYIDKTSTISNMKYNNINGVIIKLKIYISFNWYLLALLPTIAYLQDPSI